MAEYYSQSASLHNKTQPGSDRRMLVDCQLNWKDVDVDEKECPDQIISFQSFSISLMSRGSLR